MTPTRLVWSLVFGLALASASAHAEQTDSVQQAQALHDHGVELFQQGSYSEAIDSFERSDELLRNPVNDWNIMRCLQELGEYDEALLAVYRYLANRELSPEDRQAGEERREEILAAQRTAEEPPPPPPPPPPPVPTPEPPPPSDDSPSLTGPWAVLGTGLALLLTGVVLDIAAYVVSDPEFWMGDDGEFSNFNNYEDWRSTFNNLAIAGDVLVALGGAAAAGGLIWLLVARSRRSSGGATSIPLSLAAGPDGFTFRAQLRF